MPVLVGLAFSLFLSQTSSQGPPPESLKPSIDALQNLPYASPVTGDSKERTGVRTPPNAAVQPGYNFYSDRFANNAFLITNEGRVLQWWTRPSSASWGEAVPLRNGNLLVIEAWDETKRKKYPHEKAFPSRLVMLSPNSKLIWTSRVPAHHEIQILRNGAILTLTERNRKLRAVDPEHLVTDNGIAWLSPAGILRREISVYDVIRRSSLIKIKPVKPDFRHLVDLLHLNSAVAVGEVPLRIQRTGETAALYAADNLLICSRHQNFVAIFSTSRRAVVWAWGQNDLSGPHSARLLPSGNILIFDNGLGRDASRIVEVDPRTDRIIWQYQAEKPTDLYSATGGAAERLANGNTLVTNSWKYSAFEVTPEGRLVWKFVSPGKSFVYRLHRYDEGYFAKPFPDVVGKKPVPAGATNSDN
jgi:outer membrane protein assembly factor BamB